MSRRVVLAGVRQLFLLGGLLVPGVLAAQAATGYVPPVGALVGGLALGTAAAISEAGCEETPGGFGGNCWGAGAAFVVGFGFGALPGAAVGAIEGYRRRAERWERVR